MKIRPKLDQQFCYQANKPTRSCQALLRTWPWPL